MRGKRGKRGRGGGAGAGGRGPAPGPALPELDWAGLPRDLLEKVGRAVPAGDRLWFRLACRSWAAAGAGAAQSGGEGLPPGKVTRTRGANASASVARAEVVFNCLEGSDRVEFESGICGFAASSGHLDVLQWARAREYPWDHIQWDPLEGGSIAGTCKSAAKNGHLAILQWARAKGCPWDKKTCA